MSLQLINQKLTKPFNSLIIRNLINISIDNVNIWLLNNENESYTGAYNLAKLPSLSGQGGLQQISNVIKFTIPENIFVD